MIDAVAELAAGSNGRSGEGGSRGGGGATALRLRPGEMLVMLNFRCVHGRSPYKGSFDGTDRWLQRFWMWE